MIKLKVQELTLERFNKYGSFANMINPNACKIGQEPVEFYYDMVAADFGQATTVSFSVCRVQKRPLVIDGIEYHDHTGEGMLPLDGDVILYFAPATAGGDVPYDRFEAFLVPKGTLITIRPGVWHCGAFTAGSDCVNILIALPERVYKNDCTTVSLTEDRQLEIESCSQR